MTTLYRKYRPQNFADIVGQNHVKTALMQQIASSTVAHAYLFCGPRGIGKTTIARVFAKAANCEERREGKSDPCNKCRICENITIGRELDIIEMDAASHTGVDNVRENIINVARIAPGRLKYKVFIIDEVHMLSTSAFNALLKILEEPPRFVIFILCTTEVHKLPTTIVSRCQRFDFKRISLPDIVKRLSSMVKSEKLEVDKKVLEEIARHSEGHMRDAESLLDQVKAVSGQRITEDTAGLVIPRSDIKEILALADKIAVRDASAGIGIINRIIDDGVNLKKFMDDFLELSRKLMLLKISPGLADKISLEYGETLEKEISSLADTVELPYLISIIEEMIKARDEIKRQSIPQLPIEIAVARLCADIGRLPKSVSAPAGPGSGTPRQFTPRPAETAKTVPNTAIRDIPLTKRDIIDKWSEVLAKIKKYNHSLSFILRVCEPRDLNGNQLCLAFKYKFHKGRVGDNNIRQIIEKVLKDVYGHPITIEAVIDENLEVNGNGNGALAKASEPETRPETEDSAGEGAPASAEGSGAVKKEEEGGEGNMIESIIKTFGGKVVK